jgi:DNA polymerase delta subunit 3
LEYVASFCLLYISEQQLTRGPRNPGVSEHTSYESVDEEEEEMSEPAPPKRGKRGPAKPVKEKKEVAEKAEPGSAATDTIASQGDAESKPTIKASASKPMGGTKGGRKQKTLNTFFGPPKMKK